MNDLTLIDLYSNLIAGRLPVGNSSAMQVVVNHVYGLTGSTAISACIVPHQGQVYYFATESKHLASSQSPLVAFAHYLPGQPGHQGDGAYLWQEGLYAAVMLLQAGNMRFLTGLAQDVAAQIEEAALEKIAISQEHGLPLLSQPMLVVGLSEKVGKWTAGVCAGLTGISMLTFVGLQSANAITGASTQSTTSPQMIERALNSELEKLNVQQPLARQIARVQRVSATVVRSGGWIDQYRLKGQKDETFELTLPSWVSQDYLDSLGRDVVTDLRDLEGLLIVRKSVKD